MLLLACAVSIQLCAQVTKSIPPATFFDPEHDPIAIRSDTSLLLVVSEYILVKSVTARVGQKCVIDKTYKSTLKNGATAIIFEGHYTGDPGQRFSMGSTLFLTQLENFFTLPKKQPCARNRDAAIARSQMGDVLDVATMLAATGWHRGPKSWYRC